MDLAQLSRTFESTVTKAPEEQDVSSMINSLAAMMAPAPINAASINPNPQPQNHWQIAQANMAKISASIRAERNAQGMTQRDLAHKCGMSQGTITRAEKHGWISITCLLRIANALGKEIKLT